jgi:hypothetical protein
MIQSLAKPKAKGRSCAGKPRTARATGDSTTASTIRFSATLFRPVTTAKSVAWTFLTLPKQASVKLPSRGMTTVEGSFNGLAFGATLEPDGQGGHWLKVDRKLREAAGAEAGDVVLLEIAPVAEEPEPRVPADLRKALVAAHPKARAVWSDITPVARRDLDPVDPVRQAGRDSLEADTECLRHARQRETTPLLLRSVGNVCQDPQMPRRRAASGPYISKGVGVKKSDVAARWHKRASCPVNRGDKTPVELFVARCSALGVVARGLAGGHGDRRQALPLILNQTGIL